MWSPIQTTTQSQKGEIYVSCYPELFLANQSNKRTVPCTWVVKCLRVLCICPCHPTVRSLSCEIGVASLIRRFALILRFTTWLWACLWTGRVPSTLLWHYFTGSIASLAPNGDTDTLVCSWVWILLVLAVSATVLLSRLIHSEWELKSHFFLFFCLSFNCSDGGDCRGDLGGFANQIFAFT